MPSFRKLNLVHAFVGATALTLSVAPAEAASILVQQVDGENIVKVSGPLQNEDVLRFKTAVSALDAATVLLRSDGGTIFAGVGIGREIRRKGFATLVSATEGRCISACAFAWAAGHPRIAERKARIGFHAAFSYVGEKPVITGSGNALIGAYLRDLGLGDTAIIYMTEAMPSSMKWLSELDTQAIDLPVSYYIPGNGLVDFLPKGKIPIPELSRRDEMASPLPSAEITISR